MIPPGFEPGTHSLEGCCSIQLSYGTNGMLNISKADLLSRCKDTPFAINLQKKSPACTFAGRGFLGYLNVTAYFTMILSMMKLSLTSSLSM